MIQDIDHESRCAHEHRESSPNLSIRIESKISTSFILFFFFFPSNLNAFANVERYP